MPVLSLLARLRIIRGTALDFFNKTPERRREQQDILDYETLITSVNTRLTKANYDTAVELAKLPLDLRGFGHIKDQARENMLGKKIELMQQFFEPDKQAGEAQAAEWTLIHYRHACSLVVDFTDEIQLLYEIQIFPI